MIETKLYNNIIEWLRIGERILLQSFPHQQKVSLFIQLSMTSLNDSVRPDFLIYLTNVLTVLGNFSVIFCPTYSTSLRGWELVIPIVLEFLLIFDHYILCFTLLIFNNLPVLSHLFIFYVDYDPHMFYGHFCYRLTGWTHW